MSKIQWTDDTSNPIHLVKEDGKNGGHWCRKISEGCANCYAESQNQKGFFSFASKLPYTGNAPELTLDYQELEKWKKARKGKKIFVCSMTDLFGGWIPFEWQMAIFDAMKSSKHTFQVLTKRPENLYNFLIQRHEIQLERCLNNIWLGTSIESQKYVTRIDDLVKSHRHSLKVNKTFLSIEPLLEEIDLRLGELITFDNGIKAPKYKLISWVIVGGESGTNARECNINWIRSVVNQCQQFKIPVFVKQLGGNVVNENGFHIRLHHSKGGDIDEFPEDLKIRQFP